jgi:hypothetical protein
MKKPQFQQLNKGKNMLKPIEILNLLHSLIEPRLLEGMNEWELEFISNTLRVIQTNTFDHLSPKQDAVLVSIYAKHILVPKSLGSEKFKGVNDKLKKKYLEKKAGASPQLVKKVEKAEELEKPPF